jgi:hypothetical protein
MWKKYTTRKGTLTNKLTIHPGTAVFTVGSDGVRGHVGLYVGNGVCIEAKGTQYGVVTSDLSRWDEWGELVGVEYDLEADIATMPPRTLRKGSQGLDVERLQQLLNTDPRYPTKVDGIFGGDTESSVRAFQADHGLTADGIVGKQTWAELDKSEMDEDETTNFAVYAETTKIIEYVESVNTVVSVNDETATYVIENAPTSSSLP